MADDIIDLERFIERRAASEAPAGTMALWGAEGERARFALPLWRVVRLAGAERAVIFWRSASGDSAPQAFVVLDLARDPARVELPGHVGDWEYDGATLLTDRGSNGLVVTLGRKDGRIWGLLADGRGEETTLTPRDREDLIFLSGECAGLLFLRSLADDLAE